VKRGVACPPQEIFQYIHFSVELGDFAECKSNRVFENCAKYSDYHDQLMKIIRTWV